MTDSITIDVAVDSLSDHFMVEVRHAGQGRFTAMCNCSVIIPVFVMHENVPHRFGEGMMPTAKDAIGKHLREVLEHARERMAA